MTELPHVDYSRGPDRERLPDWAMGTKLATDVVAGGLSLVFCQATRRGFQESTPTLSPGNLDRAPAQAGATALIRNMVYPLDGLSGAGRAESGRKYRQHTTTPRAYIQPESISSGFHVGMQGMEHWATENLAGGESLAGTLDCWGSPIREVSG